jgi:hypothetical protein
VTLARSTPLMVDGNTQDIGFVSLSFSPPAAAKGNLSPNFLPCALITEDANQRIKGIEYQHMVLVIYVNLN